jgi:hypothetical protein
MLDRLAIISWALAVSWQPLYEQLALQTPLWRRAKTDLS